MFRGFELMKANVVAGMIAVLFFGSMGCKQSESEKNTSLLKSAMPEMTTQKDSLSLQVRSVNDEFQALKSKIDRTPETILKKPENAKLAEMVETMEKKHAAVANVIPMIEAKLEALNEMSKKNSTPELEHEITVTQQVLKAQRERMDNYMMNYRKLGNQLDSIQKEQ